MEPLEGNHSGILAEAQKKRKCNDAAVKKTRVY